MFLKRHEIAFHRFNFKSCQLSGIKMEKKQTWQRLDKGNAAYTTNPLAPPVAQLKAFCLNYGIMGFTRLV